MLIMTPRERECATERFDRLAMLENTPRDSEAQPAKRKTEFILLNCNLMAPADPPLIFIWWGDSSTKGNRNVASNQGCARRRSSHRNRRWRGSGGRSALFG
jgi:hypothetical protein